MYMRVEARDNADDTWEGIYQFLPNNRSCSRGLTVPKCLRDGKYKNTRSWFTENGFRKYYDEILSAIDTYANMGMPIQFRVIEAEDIGKIVMKGKIQVVEDLDR